MAGTGPVGDDGRIRGPWRWLSSVPIGYRKVVFNLVATLIVCAFALSLLPAWICVVEKWNLMGKVDPKDIIEVLKIQKETFIWGVGVSTTVFGAMNLGEWALRRGEVPGPPADVPKGGG